jgi:hypothetical protein
MSEDEDSMDPSNKRSRRESEESNPVLKRARSDGDRSRVMSGAEMDSRSQQEAIEAMLNLSKSTESLPCKLFVCISRPRYLSWWDLRHFQNNLT